MSKGQREERMRLVEARRAGSAEASVKTWESELDSFSDGRPALSSSAAWQKNGEEARLMQQEDAQHSGVSCIWVPCSSCACPG